MKTIFYILMFLFLMTSCEEKNEEVHIVVEKEQPKQVHFPVLIDTFYFEATYKQEQKQYVANYRPLYFGEYKDTLNINYNLSSYYLPPSDVQEVIEDSIIIKKRELARQQLKINNNRYSAYYKKAVVKEYLNWKNSKLNIIVDTTQLIRNVKVRYDTTINFAYPVILENRSDDTIEIGYDSYLPLILEVKGNSGQWEDLEIPFTSSWLNGVTILLPENEIVLTSVPILKVEKGTKWRLKIGNNYSEEFWGGE